MMKLAFRVIVILMLNFPLAASPVQSSPDSEKITPLMLQVQDAPIPFLGSDSRTHLVYELELKNFSSANLTIEKLEVLAPDGAVIQTLDEKEIVTRLQPAGHRDSTATMLGSTFALLFLHVTLPANTIAPKTLTHKIHLRAEAAPPGQQEITETGGEIAIDEQHVVVIGPPLRGKNYVSADSCCDATRHTRAALPVNGRVWLAQRYAVDWEQLDDANRIYHGPRENLASYTIFGKEAIAVADATVASVTDNLPEQTPGKYPENIPIAEADGNSVVLDLGNNHFALYAHLQPGKIRVHQGDTVKRGQVLGLVGNSGNSVAPHLHFHIVNNLSPLAANGQPYEIAAFEVTAKSPGTSAFDQAEANGTPLPTTPLTPPQHVTNGLPLDQLIINFQP
ncbi:MAG TPA: M23 family metallopeptidase [Candidatus Acidoferrales bacterium]